MPTPHSAAVHPIPAISCRFRLLWLLGGLPGTIAAACCRYGRRLPAGLQLRSRAGCTARSPGTGSRRRSGQPRQRKKARGHQKGGPGPSAGGPGSGQPSQSRAAATSRCCGGHRLTGHHLTVQLGRWQSFWRLDQRDFLPSHNPANYRCRSPAILGQPDLYGILTAPMWPARGGQR